MKKLRFNYFVLGLLSLSVLASCKKDSEEPKSDIVGTWRGQSVSLTVDGLSLREYARKLFADQGNPLTDEELAAFDDESTEELEGFAEVVEFRSDGTLLFTEDDGTTDESTWKVVGNTLTIDDGDDALAYTIERLTDSELHLLLQSDGDNSLGWPGSEDAVIRLLSTFTR